jgi:hypothetical protein
MKMELFITVLAYLCGITLLLKVILHSYLDLKHQRDKQSGSSQNVPEEYLFPYKEPVEGKYDMVVKLCNLSYWTGIIALPTCFILRLLIIFVFK